MSPWGLLALAALSHGEPEARHVEPLGADGVRLETASAFDVDGTLVGPPLVASILSADLLTKELSSSLALVLRGRLAGSGLIDERALIGNADFGIAYLFRRVAPNDDVIRLGVGGRVILPLDRPVEPVALQQRRLAAFSLGADRSLLWVPTQDPGALFELDYLLHACLPSLDYAGWLDFAVHANLGVVRVRTTVSDREVITGGFSVGLTLRELVWSPASLGLEARGSIGNEWTPDDLVPVTFDLRVGWSFGDVALTPAIGYAYLPAVGDGLLVLSLGLELFASPPSLL